MARVEGAVEKKGVAGDRVYLSGRAATVLEGRLRQSAAYPPSS
ncbi:MAG: hypothetical protein QCH35_04645 [Methanomicrobiaceae archaeon]|nr:hypothetical protein [Methanomicrobiaceae archaeon]